MTERVTNPFEDEAADYVVLINLEGQYSLWPERIAIPSGWSVRHAGSRQDCLDFIERNWLDMRPLSLVESGK